MIFLFEKFDEKTRDLYISLKKANYQVTAIAMDDDGFLDEEIVSPFNYYTRDVTKPRLPRYFNRLDLPEFYEVRSTNSSGEIYDGARLKGRIFYAEPKQKRYVRIVDHVKSDGKVSCSDHYDVYGRRYAMTSFDGDNHKVTKTYYDIHDREVIVENFVTGDLILNHNGKIYIYRSKLDFIADFISQIGLDQEPIFYNSLSYPFFLSERMPQTKQKKDVLFWQENITDHIPGNMQGIVNGTSMRTGKIVVQSQDVYQRMLKLGVPEDQIAPLGFIYDFKKSNKDVHQALIMTNSDSIEGLKELVEGCPNIQFHIGAITEMSQKLLDYGHYRNVHLYPNIKNEQVKALFDRCAIYLDINNANEILNALRQAFIHEEVIYALRETIHNRTYTAPAHIYDLPHLKALIEKLQHYDQKIYQHDLAVQHDFAFVSTVDDYHQVLD